MRLAWVIFLFLSFEHTQAATWKDLLPRFCFTKTLQQTFPEIKPALGKKVDASKISKLLPYSKLDYEVYQLGKGSSGYTYRIIPTQKPDQSFIVKIMRPSDAIRDQKDFEMLRSFFKNNSDIRIPSSKVLQIKNQAANEYGEVLLQLSDTRGQTLFDLLSDPNLSEKTKTRLKEKYLKIQNELELTLTRDYQLFTKTFPASREYFPAVKEAGPLSEEKVLNQPDFLKVNVPVKTYLKYWRNQDPEFNKYFRDSHYLEIYFKSDNIIVDANENFTLIDPF